MSSTILFPVQGEITYQIPLFDQFNGHFPGNPVLPGAMIVKLSWSFLNEILGNRQFLEIKASKFKAPMIPFQSVVIQYLLEAKKGEFIWFDQTKENTLAEIDFIYE